MSSKPEVRLAYGLLLMTVAVWGATFVFVKGALRDCTPLLFNQLRMLLAFAALALFNFRQLRRVSRKTLAAGAVAGVLLAAGYELQTTGLVYTSPSRSAFLTGMVVVLVPLLSAWPRLRLAGSQAPGMVNLAGAAGAFTGIVLLTTPASTQLRDFSHGFNRGDALSLLCAVAFALHLLALSHLAPRVPTSQLATLQIGFAALTMSFATPLLEVPTIHWTRSLVGALLICALFATAAAFSIQSWAQKHLRATHTAMLLALEPAFALLLSVSLLGERLQVRSGTGAALILVSLLATELLSAKKIAAQPEANAA